MKVGDVKSAEYACLEMYYISVTFLQPHASFQFYFRTGEFTNLSTSAFLQLGPSDRIEVFSLHLRNFLLLYTCF